MLISAAINFVLVAAVVYFLVVVPYNRLRKKGEVEQAQDTELSLLTEIRNLLKDGAQRRDRHRAGHRSQPRHREDHQRRQASAARNTKQPPAEGRGLFSLN